MANLLLVGLFVAQVVASFQAFRHEGSLRSVGLLAVNLLFLSLFLSRRPAREKSEQPAHWLLGVTGTAMPLLMRSGGGSASLHLGAAIQVSGLLLLVPALLSLRRSFGVVAANRGVRSGGMYRFVRHPVYLAELIALTGFVVGNPTLFNLCILACEFGLQFARAVVEERLLLADPAYQAYCTQVRFRLVPGLV